MICLMPKPSQKKFPKWLEFIYALHQAQALTPLITQYGLVFHRWWDLMRLKQLFSIFVCHTQVFAEFSGRGN